MSKSNGGNPQEADPWDDIDKLVAPQNYKQMAGVKQELSTVPVRKPNNQVFFRIHPNPDYRRDFVCLELKEERQLFIVRPEFTQEIDPSQLSTRTFYLGKTRQGIVFLWPIKLPDPDGGKNEWAISARLAAMRATKQWTRVWANMALGAYEHSYAEHITDEPVWPDLTFGQICKIAFKSMPMIESHDHPAMKYLRGEL